MAGCTPISTPSLPLALWADLCWKPTSKKRNKNGNKIGETRQEKEDKKGGRPRRRPEAKTRREQGRHVHGKDTATPNRNLVGKNEKDDLRGKVRIKP